MNRTFYTLVLSLLLFGSTTNLVAEEGWWFAGVGLGESENRDYRCDDCGAAIGSLDDSGITWKLFGGYGFNRHLALFGGYIDLADTDAAGEDNLWNDEIDVDGFYGAIQGTLPLGESFDVYATLGLFDWEQKVTFDDASESFDGTDPFFGLGASYSFDQPGFKVQLEWTRYRDVGNDDPFFQQVNDYDIYTINGVFQF